MKVIIYTQIYENYAWNEDGSIGTGTEAYWKAKGGNEYVVRDVKDETEATMAVLAVRDQIESANDYFTETVIDWSLVDNNYLTDFERSQLDYDGKITYPAKELQFA